MTQAQGVLLPDVDPKALQKVTAQLCAIFDGFFLWTMEIWQSNSYLSNLSRSMRILDTITPHAGDAHTYAAKS